MKPWDALFISIHVVKSWEFGLKTANTQELVALRFTQEREPNAYNSVTSDDKNIEENDNIDDQVSVWLAYHCVKSVRILSFSGPYFPAFGLNTDKYFLSLCIQSKYGTRNTPNTDTFHSVYVTASCVSKKLTVY